MPTTLPHKLNTMRSHRIIQFFLERSKRWDDNGRDLSIYWSMAHMITAAQLMRLLAVARGLEPDISAIAGAIHDIASMESGRHENHAARSLDYIDALIGEFNDNNQDCIVTEAEIQLLKGIIPQHSDKTVISDNPYEEMLKDADALDRYFHGIETRKADMPRLIKALAGVGIEAEFEA